MFSEFLFFEISFKQTVGIYIDDIHTIGLKYN